MWTHFMCWFTCHHETTTWMEGGWESLTWSSLPLITWAWPLIRCSITPQNWMARIHGMWIAILKERIVVNEWQPKRIRPNSYLTVCAPRLQRIPLQSMLTVPASWWVLTADIIRVAALQRRCPSSWWWQCHCQWPPVRRHRSSQKRTLLVRLRHRLIAPAAPSGVLSNLEDKSLKFKISEQQTQSDFKSTAQLSYPGPRLYSLAVLQDFNLTSEAHILTLGERSTRVDSVSDDSRKSSSGSLDCWLL